MATAIESSSLEHLMGGVAVEVEKHCSEFEKSPKYAPGSSWLLGTPNTTIEKVTIIFIGIHKGETEMQLRDCPVHKMYSQDVLVEAIRHEIHEFKPRIDDDHYVLRSVEVRVQTVTGGWFFDDKVQFLVVDLKVETAPDPHVQ